MAREFYGYFDSIDADVREYDAAQFAHILKAAVQNGVSSHEGGLEVTADGLGLTTRVAYGGCVIEGHVYVLEDDGGGPLTLTHEPSGTADRIDRVVVRLENDQSARIMGVRLLTGTPSASPQPPALTRNAQVWELSLAQVRVRASATTVAAEDVTDERGDPSACGYATPRWLDRAVAAQIRDSLTVTGLRAGRPTGQGPRRENLPTVRRGGAHGALQRHPDGIGVERLGALHADRAGRGRAGYGRSLRGRGHERRVGVRAGRGADRGVGVRGTRHGGE